MDKAITYCRVSTEEQAEDGHHSLSAQESICQRVAAEKGYYIIRIFRDPGKSATTMNRPGIKDALALCQTDRSIKALLVQDTDRLARNTQDHLAIRAILRKSGVKLISTSQPMLEDSAEGKMIDTIIASVNQFQSDITSRKTVKGLEEKVRNGGWPCQAPLGYTNVGHGEGGKERLVVMDPETSPLIKKMFQLYATGNYSLHELRDVMFKDGLRSRNGKKLHVSKVHEILQNPFYIGIVRWRGIEAKGQHQPLIEKPLFGAVDNVLRANGGHRGRRRTYNFLLRGYVFCAKCGRRLIGECHINKKAAYYRCHKRGGCGPATPVDKLEVEVASKFNEIALPDNFIRMVVNALRARVQKDYNTLESEATRLRNQRTKLENQRAALEQKLLDKVISDDDFSRMRKRLDSNFRVIEDRLNDLKWQQNTNIDEVQEVIAFTSNLGNSYLNASPNVKRMLLQFAWERFEVRGLNIINAVPSMFFRTLRADFEASSITHKPVLLERASVQRGDYHPTQFLTGTAMVRLRTEWGPVHQANRPQKSKKIAGRNNFFDLTPFWKLIKDTKYLSSLLEQFRAIKHALKAQKVA